MYRCRCGIQQNGASMERGDFAANFISLGCCQQPRTASSARQSLSRLVHFLLPIVTRAFNIFIIQIITLTNAQVVQHATRHYYSRDQINSDHVKIFKSSESALQQSTCTFNHALWLGQSMIKLHLPMRQSACVSVRHDQLRKQWICSVANHVTVIWDPVSGNMHQKDVGLAGTRAPGRGVSTQKGQWLLSPQLWNRNWVQVHPTFGFMPPSLGSLLRV